MRRVRDLLLILAAVGLLAGCGAERSADNGGDAEAVFRAWADASTSGDWARVGELSCASEAARLDAKGDQSAAAILDSGRVRFALSQITPPVLNGTDGSISAVGTYQLVLDEARLQAAIRQALLDGGVPEADVDLLAKQGLDLLRGGYVGLLDPNQITSAFPLVQEDGAWRVCAVGFSPLTIALGQ